MTTTPTPATVSGRALSAWSRAGRFGTWHALERPGGEADGPPHGALRVDRALLAPQGARDRLKAAVVAVARLRLPGVPATVDLVAESGHVWLIVARPPVRTIADLLREGAPGPDEGSAASVLNETAQTLLALHAAGLAHGSLSPGSVVLGADGTALLMEAALATALGDRSSPVSAQRDDITAWAALARALGAAWAPAGTPAAELFARCSTTADSGDLAAARTTLTAGRAALPRDFLERAALRTAAVAAWAELTGREGAVEAAPADSAVTGAAVADSAVTGEAVADSAVTGTAVASPAVAGEVVADTTVADAGAACAMDSPGNWPEGAAPSDDLATVLGRRNRSTTPPATAESGEDSDAEADDEADDEADLEADDEILLRFGPGVPLTEEESLRALWAAPPPVRTRLKRRRGPRLIGAVAVLAAVAVTLWLLLRPTAGPTVAGVRVDAPARQLGCGQTADVTGVVTTDGGGGPFTYRWLRSDGQASGDLTRTARRGEREVAVHLQWTVRGHGLFRGTARLQVLRPGGLPIEAEGTFSYACA